MKGLFVIHSVNLVYGASRSLALLLKNIDYDYDIVFPKSISAKVTDEKIREVYGARIGKIFRLRLPFEKIYLGKERHTIFSAAGLKFTLSQLVSRFDFFKLRRIVKKGGYDFLYLNSLTLYPLVQEKTFIHVREVLDCNETIKRSVTSKLERAEGVIFIDKATLQPFAENKKLTSILLSNPYDMTRVGEVDTERIREQWGISSEDVVYSILGSIIEVKGVREVLSAFIEANISHAKLLIVGDYTGEYAQSCRDLAKGNRSVIFTGELSDPTEIYAISHFVVRGEPMFCVGRTIYEALFSGCSVILPGEANKDFENLDMYEQYQGAVFFYEPRNIKALSQLMRNLQQPENIRSFRSNVQEYVYQHTSFITDSL